MAPVPGGRVNVGIVLAGGRWRAALRPMAPRAVADESFAPQTTRVRRRVAARAARGRIAGARRSPIASPVVRGPAGSWPATRPGSSTRSPGRDCIGRSSRRGWPTRRLPRSCTVDPPHWPTTMRRCAADSRARTSSRGWPSCSSRSRGCSTMRRGGSRAGARLAERMGLLMGDLVPASGAVDPRYLAAILRP